MRILHADGLSLPAKMPSWKGGRSSVSVRNSYAGSNAVGERNGQDASVRQNAGRTGRRMRGGENFEILE
jgi:hypothetical protein